MCKLQRPDTAELGTQLLSGLDQTNGAGTVWHVVYICSSLPVLQGRIETALTPNTPVAMPREE